MLLFPDPVVVGANEGAKDADGADEMDGATEWFVEFGETVGTCVLVGEFVGDPDSVLLLDSSSVSTCSIRSRLFPTLGSVDPLERLMQRSRPNPTARIGDANGLIILNCFKCFHCTKNKELWNHRKSLSPQTVEGKLDVGIHVVRIM